MRNIKSKNVILLALTLVLHFQSAFAQVDSLFNKVQELVPAAIEAAPALTSDLINKIKQEKKSKNASKKNKKDKKEAVSKADSPTKTEAVKKTKREEEITKKELDESNTFEGLDDEYKERPMVEVVEEVATPAIEQDTLYDTSDTLTDVASSMPSTENQEQADKNDSTSTVVSDQQDQNGRPTDNNEKNLGPKDNGKETTWSLLKSVLVELKTVMVNRYDQFERFITDHFKGWKIRILLFLLLYLFAYVYTKQTNRSIIVPELMQASNASNGLFAPIFNIASSLIMGLITPFWFLFDFTSQYVFPAIIRSYGLIKNYVFISGFGFVIKCIYNGVFRLFIIIGTIIVHLIPKLFKREVMLISLLTLTCVYALNFLPAIFMKNPNSERASYITILFQSISYVILAIGVGLLQLRYINEEQKTTGNTFVWLGSNILRVMVPALLLIAVQALLLWIVVFTSAKWTLTPIVLILGYGLSIWGCINYLLLLLLMPALIGFLNKNKTFTIVGLWQYSLRYLPQYLIAIPLGIVFFSAVSVISQAAAFGSTGLTMNVFSKLKDRNQTNYDTSLKPLKNALNVASWYDVKKINDDSLQQLISNYNARMALDYKRFEFNRIYENTKKALTPIIDKKEYSPYSVYKSLSDKLKTSNKNQNVEISGAKFDYSEIGTNLNAVCDTLRNASKAIKGYNKAIKYLELQINKKQEELNSICEEQTDETPKKKKENAPLFEREELDKCDLMREKVSREIVELKQNQSNILVKKQFKEMQRLREESISRFLMKKNIETGVCIATTKQNEKWLVAGITLLIALIYGIANMLFMAGFALTYAEINRYNWSPWHSKFSDYLNEVRKIDARNPLMGIFLAYLFLYLLSMIFGFEADDYMVRFFKALYADLQSVYDQLLSLIEQIKAGLVSLLNQ